MHHKYGVVGRVDTYDNFKEKNNKHIKPTLRSIERLLFGILFGLLHSGLRCLPLLKSFPSLILLSLAFFLILRDLQEVSLLQKKTVAGFSPALGDGLTSLCIHRVSECGLRAFKKMLHVVICRDTRLDDDILRCHSRF